MFSHIDDKIVDCVSWAVDLVEEHTPISIVHLYCVLKYAVWAAVLWVTGILGRAAFVQETETGASIMMLVAALYFYAFFRELKELDLLQKEWQEGVLEPEGREWLRGMWAFNSFLCLLSYVLFPTNAGFWFTLTGFTIWLCEILLSLEAEVAAEEAPTA